MIEADGALHGWIGGACAEPAVLREARHVLDEGAPRLLRLGPADELEAPDRDGVVTVPIACGSDGALDVFLEPVLPAPHVVVAGASPAVRTFTGLLRELGWRVTEATSDTIADATDAAAVVVATQGHDDEAAVEAALATSAPYVGVVASGRRAERLRGYLRDRGWQQADLDRIRSPAGLDLGRTEHREIAVALLAELVRLRAAGALAGPATATTPASATAVDPVCGMTVELDTRHTVELDGSTGYFCCPACARTFASAPDRYMAGLSSPASP